MQLFFIDDSGSIPKGHTIVHNHFVLGGLVIPEEHWHNIENDFNRICKKYQVKGEVKWRFFGQKIGREDKENTISHLAIKDRDAFRTDLLTLFTKYKSVKIISAITHLPTIYPTTAEVVYASTYKPLTERFQYYLQDLSRANGYKCNGIIICDHRNPNQDRVLSNFHNDLLKSGDTWKSQYPNLIEHVFLSPSHYSIGLQLADLVAGVIFRHFEHGDARWYQLIKNSFRKNPSDQETMEGYGLVKLPKGEWKEKTLSRETVSNLQ